MAAVDTVPVARGAFARAFQGLVTAPIVPCGLVPMGRLGQIRPMPPMLLTLMPNAQGRGYATDRQVSASVSTGIRGLRVEDQHARTIAIVTAYA